MGRIGGVLAVVVALCATTRSGRADGQDYGQHVALADGASVAVFYAAMRVANASDGDRGVKVAAGVGLGSYVLLAPAVHLIGHGRGDRAAVSLGMRLVPTTLLLTTGRCGGGDVATACVAGQLLLAATGALAATAVDIFVVSDGEASGAAPMMLNVGGRF